MLSKAGIRSGYKLGRLKGCNIYGTTRRETGRGCICNRHHQSNNFYCQLQKNGNVSFHCYASECSKANTVIGQYITDLSAMLEDSELWQPGRDVDAALLKNVERLANKKFNSKKSTLEEQPFFPLLEQRVCTYLACYFTFITTQVTYVKQTLHDDGTVVDFKSFNDSLLRVITRPYGWAFKLFDNSPLRDTLATKARFVGNPHDDRVAHDEFNLCKGCMPLLSVPARPLNTDEQSQLQPILDHIKESLCAGNETDFSNFMAWIAHVMQHPEQKVGWCPVLISEQGVGKSIILNSLFKGIFADLGHHVTNFSQVVQR